MEKQQLILEPVILFLPQGWGACQSRRCPRHPLSRAAGCSRSQTMGEVQKVRGGLATPRLPQGGCAGTSSQLAEQGQDSAPSLPGAGQAPRGQGQPAQGWGTGWVYLRWGNPKLGHLGTKSWSSLGL